MTISNDADYDRERERQERRASAAAVDVAARHAHQELADRYADRAWDRREEVEINLTVCPERSRGTLPSVVEAFSASLEDVSRLRSTQTGGR